MGKQKVHELAKELGTDAKTLMEKLKSIGIEVKSHLSNLSDEDISKIKSSNLSFEKEPQIQKETKNVKSNKSGANPIIIRREIQVVDSNIKEEKVEKIVNKDIGIVKRNEKKDFNIINRNRQKTQVGSIADLFKKNEDISPVGNTSEILEKTLEKSAQNTKKEEKIVEKIDKKEETVTEPVEGTQEVKKIMNNNEQRRPMGNRPYNSNKEPYKPNNRPPYKPQNRPTGSNTGNGQNKGFRPNNSNGNRPVKNTAPSATEMLKPTQKEYTGKVNKTKINPQEDAKKQVQKFRDDDSEISMDKIKDLKNQNSLSNMFNDTEGGMLDYYDLSNNRRNKKIKKNKNIDNKKREFEKNKIFELTNIKIPEYITVKDLAESLKKNTTEIIKKLLSFGIMATINQELDFDTAFLVAQEFNVTAEKAVKVSDEEILFDDTDDKEENLLPRAPIVVVMGHVDHGKTSLLDAIRSTNVIENEAGGITQHIGAYRVKINNRDITFLDTPGHEAFTSMRARGAQVTDIAILVVAADDGIMPQTVEAINHAKAADVPIIVAINKIDKEGANIEKVKEDLTKYELVPEEWGGETICVPISAKKKIGIDSLLEMVLLVADMKNLRADPNKQAKGTVIESRLDNNKGVITTLLVQRGTLSIGDTIVLGNVIGKIRAMVDDKGKKIKDAGPSMPVEITGLPEVAEGGDIFYEVENEKVAKHLIEKRKIKQRESELKANNRVTLDDLFNQIEQGKIKDLNLIVKADVQGSVEALRDSLLKLSTDAVKIKVVHANVGAVTVSDVTLAKVTNAIIIGFNVRPDVNAKAMADLDKVDIKLYSVIYTAIDDVKKAMKGMLDPTYEEEVLGLAVVRNVFKVSNVGTIAGSYVLNGKIVRNALVRLIRDGVVIYSGKIESLKRFKDDAKEVAENYECGIQIAGYNDVKENDQMECYIMKEIRES